MSQAIRLATPSDVPQLVPLFKEMEDHYQGPDAIGADAVRRRLVRWFDETNDSAMLIAINDDGLPVGHAVIAPLFPAGDLRTAWFLKDLFVSSRAQGNGIGKRLLAACGAETRRREGQRLDLTVDNGNHRAKALYEEMGAVDTRKTYLRWDGNALNDLADQFDRQHP